MNFSLDLSPRDSCPSSPILFEDRIRKRVNDSFKDITLGDDRIFPSDDSHDHLHKVFMLKLDQPLLNDLSTDKQSDSNINVQSLHKDFETSDYSDFEESSNSVNKSKRKPDHKKNVPGLVRDRVLTGIKKIVKTARTHASFDGMIKKFQSLKPDEQERLRYIFEKLDDKGKFGQMKSFLIYLKSCYNKSWKQNKTWKKFKEFLSIPEHRNACVLFKEILNEFYFGNGKIDLDVWLENFKGKDQIKTQLLSNDFKRDMKEFIESI